MSQSPHDKHRVDGEKMSLHPLRVAQWLEARDDWSKAQHVFPIYVELSPVGYCNHACTFCGVDYMLDRPDKPSIPRALMERLVTDLKANGVLSVMFAGAGEPLLYKPLADVLAHANSVQLDCSITTNGVLLEESFAQRALALEHLRWIKVSLNAGDADTYAAIHRTRATDFDKVLRNLERAVKIRAGLGTHCTLGAQMVALPEVSSSAKGLPQVHPSNMHTAAPLARRLRDIGVDYLVVKPYSQHLVSEDTRVYENTSYANSMAWGAELESLSTDAFKVVFRANTMASLEKPERGYQTCHATPFQWAYVEADGGVWGCSAYLGRTEGNQTFGDERFMFGNINQQSFKDVWQGPRRQACFEYVRNGLDISQCRKNCRMHHVNTYLEAVLNPGPHGNFI